MEKYRIYEHNLESIEGLFKEITSKIADRKPNDALILMEGLMPKDRALFKDWLACEGSSMFYPSIIEQVFDLIGD